MFGLKKSKEELNQEVIEVKKNIDILNTKMKNLEAELKLQKEENAKLWRIHKYAKDGEVTHTFKLETESCGMFIHSIPVITIYNDGRELEPIKLQELTVHHMDNIKHESRTFSYDEKFAYLNVITEYPNLRINHSFIFNYRNGTYIHSSETIANENNKEESEDV